MKTIWKHQLDYKTGAQTVPMPEGALFLTAQLQLGFPVLWFEVETTKEKEERLFHLIKTGEEIPGNCKYYRGTIQLHGQYVLHVYEEDVNDEDIAMRMSQYGDNIATFPLMPTGTA